VTGFTGFDLKRVMRTGTVASVDNRNWELGDHALRRLSQSRAIALNMESAAVAANGFRFRVPYGTLLCVSDKPLQGEIKADKIVDEVFAKPPSRANQALWERSAGSQETRAPVQVRLQSGNRGIQEAYGRRIRRLRSWSRHDPDMPEAC
jgi:hypothetical protein